MHNILSEIEKSATPGKVIPKPAAVGSYKVKDWGKRRGERALIYTIPNNSNPSFPHEKCVTEGEWVQAFERLMSEGELSRSWFEKKMAGCNKEGGCNFTTIGGIFELLGYARHEHGLYRMT